MTGVILIAAGAFLLSNTPEGLVVLANSMAGGSIGVGVFIVLISFLGGLGAISEKSMMLKTYFALLFILIIMELSVGIASYVEQAQVISLLL